MATTKIHISSTLRSAGGEVKDVGPEWDVEIAANEDGSPCLKALADLRPVAEAAARISLGDYVQNAGVYWGGHKVAFDGGGGAWVIYPLSDRQIRAGVERLSVPA